MLVLIIITITRNPRAKLGHTSLSGISHRQLKNILALWSSGNTVIHTYTCIIVRLVPYTYKVQWKLSGCSCDTVDFYRTGMISQSVTRISANIQVIRIFLFLLSTTKSAVGFNIPLQMFCGPPTYILIHTFKSHYYGYVYCGKFFLTNISVSDNYFEIYKDFAFMYNN